MLVKWANFYVVIFQKCPGFAPCAIFHEYWFVYKLFISIAKKIIANLYTKPCISYDTPKIDDDHHEFASTSLRFLRDCGFDHEIRVAIGKNWNFSSSRQKFFIFYTSSTIFLQKSLTKRKK